MTDSLRQHLESALGATYSFERELGGGGMARVFVATETALGRSVVVKVVAPDVAEGVSADRFAREMKLAARLQQANIVPVLSAGVANGMPYYTMPFVTGESLRARMISGSPVPLAEAVNILRDVARALAFAHQHGIVHRDIKPENILLSGGAAVVTDFGIAKAMTAASTTRNVTRGTMGALTQAGYAVGTPMYMAPEQVAADGKVDHRADIYAWGLVAWELLAGKHPFDDAISSQALITAQLTVVPPDVGEIRADAPPGLSRLIDRCLAKDADDRPSSATELIAALDQVQTTGGGIRTRAVRTRSVARGRLIFVMLLVVAAGVVWLLNRQITNGATPSSPRSLAVLPFASVGGDTDNNYFAEGMAEEVATALAKVPGLQLAGRNSANAHAGKSPQEVGRLLNVGAVLQGTVRRAGERMRVSVELTNATSGLVMWTESYERRVEDVFAVQDEISREIVNALRMTLGGGAAPAPSADRGTENLSAYDDYLRGMYQYQRRGVPQAVDAFSAAIEKDSSFARAWAGLGQALVSLTEYADVPANQVLVRAGATAERAIRLNPNLAEGHLAAATAYMFANRWAEADSAFRRAIGLDSTLALARQFYGRYLWAVGRLDEAVQQAEVARTRDPVNAAVLGNLASILTAAGRHEDGLAAGRAAFELDSTVLAAIIGYAHSLVANGRGAEARALGERVLRYSTDPRARGTAAYALGRGGDTAGARAIYNEMGRRRGEWRSAMARVRASFGLGDTALALDALEAAVAAGEPIGTNHSFIAPMFDPVRSSPRFAAVVRAYGLDPAVFTKPRP